MRLAHPDAAASAGAVPDRSSAARMVPGACVTASALEAAEAPAGDPAGLAAGGRGGPQAVSAATTTMIAHRGGRAAVARLEHFAVHMVSAVPCRRRAGEPVGLPVAQRRAGVEGVAL